MKKFLLLLFICPSLVSLATPGFENAKETKESTSTVIPKKRVPRIRPEKVFLFDAQGDIITMSNLLQKHQGKVIYQLFWADWCENSHRSSIPAVNELAKKYQTQDVVFLLIDYDSKLENWQKIDQGLQSSMPKNVYSYYVLSNRKPNIRGLMKINGAPTYNFYDKTGKMVYHEVTGPTQTLTSEIIDELLKK